MSLFMTDHGAYATALPGDVMKAIEPGETVLWVGQPDLSLFYVAYAKRNMIALVAMLGISLVWCLSFSVSFGSLWDSVFQKPMLLFALFTSIAIVLTGFLFFPKVLSEQRYVLTNGHLYIRYPSRVAKLSVPDIAAVTKDSAGIRVFARTPTGMRPFVTFQCLSDPDKTLQIFAQFTNKN